MIKLVFTSFNPRASLYHGDPSMENYAQWVKQYMESLQFGGRNFNGCGVECVEIKKCLTVKEKLQKANCKPEKLKHRIWKKIGSMVSSLTFF